MILSGEKDTKHLDIIILMAGEGNRMRPYTSNCPKALLRINEKGSIFKNTVEIFNKQGWNINIIPIIGHKWDKVEEEIEGMQGNMNFFPTYNPFYSSAGPFVSLWLGILKSEANHAVILNGDTLLSKLLVEEVIHWLEAGEGFGLCITKTDKLSKDDMKILLDENNALQKVSKDIKRKDAIGKSAGVFCIKGRKNIKMLKDTVDRLIKKQHTLDRKYHWHNLVNEIQSQVMIELIDVELESWVEVDTPEEYKKILKSINNEYKDD